MSSNAVTIIHGRLFKGPVIGPFRVIDFRLPQEIVFYAITKAVLFDALDKHTVSAIGVRVPRKFDYAVYITGEDRRKVDPEKDYLFRVYLPMEDTAPNLSDNPMDLVFSGDGKVWFWLNDSVYIKQTRLQRIVRFIHRLVFNNPWENVL